MELSRQALIDKIQSKVTSIEDFNYDKLTAPPLYTLLSQQDIDNLYYIATSVKYSGKPAQKYAAMDAIMNARGFVKLSAGTNRVVYRFLESTDFVVKVAADVIGIGDNPREFENQFIFKPFVTKVFEVSPCGTVGVFERVNPITSREEFLSAADDIFDVINEWFIGKYIMADIGTKYFMNWGIRTYSTGKEGSVAFGPVLLDFPYVYELDGNKLFCSAVDHNSETGLCGGVIDYDNGFNSLVCTKCGIRYRVKELAKKIKNNEIKIISNTGREIKKMKIGRYDKDGNIITTEGVIKEPVAKVTKAEPKKDIKIGSLAIDRSKLQAFAQQSSDVKVVNQPLVNNNLRANPANSRGIVKAPASSNIKIELNPAESTIKADSKKEYDILIEYNAEDGIMVLSNGTDEITATMDVVPDEFMQSAIENSAEYTEYLNGVKKIDKLSAELEKVKGEADKNFEELSDENKKLREELEEEKARKSVDDSDERIAKEVARTKDELEAEYGKTILELTEKFEEACKEIGEIKNENNKLKEDIENAKTSDEVKSLTINGIPVSINPEFVPIDHTEYGEAATLDGKVEDICLFASPEKETHRKVVVFPINEDEGDYLTDENENIICVASINGYLIDDLMAKVADEEIVVTEEKAEE